MIYSDDDNPIGALVGLVVLGAIGWAAIKLLKGEPIFKDEEPEEDPKLPNVVQQQSPCEVDNRLIQHLTVPPVDPWLFQQEESQVDELRAKQEKAYRDYLEQQYQQARQIEAQQRIEAERARLEKERERQERIAEEQCRIAKALAANRDQNRLFLTAHFGEERVTQWLQSTATAEIGTTITLFDVEDEEEVCYKIVGPPDVTYHGITEVVIPRDLAWCEMSSYSPMGAAVLHLRVGNSFTVRAPGGEYKYILIGVQ